MVWLLELTFAGLLLVLGKCSGNSDNCNLPAKKGPCEDFQVKWYYNKDNEKCEPFVYGGCAKNANNFDSEELCMLHCPIRSRCLKPRDVGHGDAKLERYFYDVDLGRCQYFEYGGNGGNMNNFKTFRECMLTCPVKSPCVERSSVGGCDETPGVPTRIRRRWYYDRDTLECKTFWYFGCGGNGNRFYTKEECQDKCNGCSLEKAPGPCKGSHPRWYYDTGVEKCMPFTYGGCQSNFNNYWDEESCKNSCE